MSLSPLPHKFITMMWSCGSFEATFLPFDENIVGGEALSYPDGPNAETPDTLFIKTSRPLTVDDKIVAKLAYDNFVKAEKMNYRGFNRLKYLKDNSN